MAISSRAAAMKDVWIRGAPHIRGRAHVYRAAERVYPSLLCQHQSRIDLRSHRNASNDPTLLTCKGHPLENGFKVVIGALRLHPHLVVGGASAIPPKAEVVDDGTFGKPPLNRRLHFVVALGVQVLADLGGLAQLLFGNGQERQHVGYRAGYFGQNRSEFRRIAECGSTGRLIFGWGAAASPGSTAVAGSVTAPGLPARVDWRRYVMSSIVVGTAGTIVPQPTEARVYPLNASLSALAGVSTRAGAE